MSSFNALLKFNGVVRRTSVKWFSTNELSSTENEKKIHLLKRLTDCSIGDATKLFVGKKKKFIESVNEEKITKSYTVLQNFGFSKNDIAKNVSVLMIHHRTIEHHLGMLEEASLKKSRIDCTTLCRFYTIFRSTVYSLKVRGYIDKSSNVIDNYCELLGLPSNLDINYPDSTTLFDLHYGIVQAMLNWKTDGLWEVDGSVSSRLNYKSARLLSRTYDLLTNDFRISKNRICKYPIFLAMYPDNLENILKFVPTLGDNDVRDIATLWPKLLYTNFESLIEIDKILKEFGVSKEAVLSTPAVYTLTPENVRSRLKHIATDPDLLQFKYHPKYLRTLLYYNKMTSRLSQLRQANMKCFSLHLLNAPESEFSRHVDHLDKSNQYDSVTLLCMKLSADPIKVREKLKKNPYWLYISHKDVQESLLFLLEEGFTKDEILSSIVIVLYPKHILKEELPKLNSRSEFKSCKDPNTGALRRDTVLPLLLYALEQPLHFSKDSIWAYRSKDLDASKAI